MPNNPTYDPALWNSPLVISSTNCYAYVANDPFGHPPGRPQPGDHGGHPFSDVDWMSFGDAAVSDGMIRGTNPPSPGRRGIIWSLCSSTKALIITGIGKTAMGSGVTNPETPRSLTWMPRGTRSTIPKRLIGITVQAAGSTIPTSAAISMCPPGESARVRRKRAGSPR